MTHIHLIGIGGTGLSAIARVLLEMGYTVSGSDRLESSFTQDLRSAGATISIGHKAENVHGADLVVRSSAIPDDNPEVLEAKKQGIPVKKRSEFLGSLTKGKTCVAVAGTHGKTTTTSMIAWILTALDMDPSFICGGVLANLGVNARAGKGKTFVIEADEYDRMFLGLKPDIAVITNIEHDHPDCYPTAEDFQAAFVEFAGKLSRNGTLVYCAEDPAASRLAEGFHGQNRKRVGYGWSHPGSQGDEKSVLAKDLQPQFNGGYSFSAMIDNQSIPVELQVPGRHNVLNSLGALGVSQTLGLDLPAAVRALREFRGAGRRFEVLGKAGEITVIDDYAHHPTEIRATLSAARDRFPGKRIWAVWQPHTYSRTRALFSEFISAFQDADAVVVTEVYKAREPQEDFSAAELVKAMDHPAVQFIAELPQVTGYLIEHLSPGDVLLVLSAGDADQVSRDILNHLQEV